MTQVFISYSRKDLTFVEQLAADLKETGLDVWYDLSGLEGGDRWSRAIEQAIRDSQFVIVVLSPDSNESEWVEKEFIFASSLRRKIIPLLHRACDPRLTYVNLHYLDIQGGKYKQNFNQILRALNIQPKPPTPVAPIGRASSPTESIASKESQAASLTYETPPNKLTLSNGMEFMRVPGGSFLMGSTKENKLAYDDEHPQHIVDIPYDYWMARYPVTNELYNAYVKSKGINHPVSGWEKKRDHPVVYVKWTDVMAYCQWLNNLLKGELPSGLVLRLPTEAEWEKAARGGKGNEWPWGNEFDKNKCNSSEGGNGDTTPVGLYSPRGDSPYGCADMAGNVWEWTHSLLKEYPYKVNDGREDENAASMRVLRGGSYHFESQSVRCALRYGDYPDLRDWHLGFRVVLVSPLLS
jgi:formylglycine-generating enzyme required for sulfatase activity